MQKDGAKIVVRCVIQHDGDARYAWLSYQLLPLIMSHETHQQNSCVITEIGWVHLILFDLLSPQLLFVTNPN